MEVKIKIEPSYPFHIKVQCNLEEYLLGLKDCLSAHVPNYEFMPSFDEGYWDGRISFFKYGRFPYGLLPDFLLYHKKWNDVELVIDNSVKTIFSNGIKIKPVYNLCYKPWDYQKETVEAGLRYTKMITRIATGGGKSYVISTLCNCLDNYVNKQLIVVPTIQLVEQFYQDLIMYGMKPDIGRLHNEIENQENELNRKILISTWQSLSTRHDLLPQYNSIFVDECHLATADELQTILTKCTNAKYRYGFTGTLPSNKAQLMSLKAFIGPVVKEYPYSYLAERGYVAKCNINLINLEYVVDDKFFGKYSGVREAVFQDHFTLDVMRNLILEIEGNILMLVTFKRKEGDFLKNELQRMFPKKEVVFLSGDDSLDIREDAKTTFAKNEGNMIFIATYGIFQLGINIPTLKNLFLAAPAKSEIRVLQSIGRALRIHASKVGGAEIFDMNHQVKSLQDSIEARQKYYEQEGFNIRERNYKQEHGGEVYF